MYLFFICPSYSVAERDGSEENFIFAQSQSVNDLLAHTGAKIVGPGHTVPIY